MSTKIKRILVPTDFSKNSKKALRQAVALARRAKASITLLNVIQDTGDLLEKPLYFSAAGLQRIRGHLHAESQEKFKRLLRGVDRRGVRITTVTAEGSPVEEILDLSKRLKADLIVIGTRGLGGIAHALLGSTAERVIRYSKRMVLVVPAGARGVGRL